MCVAAHFANLRTETVTVRYFTNRKNNPMAILILQFVLLALVIVVAGTVLATSADCIADATGYGGSLVGFFLLAAATSLPEFAIDCNAARLGAADLAVGDLLGSSIFNLLILGVVDLAHRRSVRILSPVSSAHALSAIASLVLTGIVLVTILLPFKIDIEFLGIGLGPWLILFAYAFSVRLIFLNQRLAKHAEEPTKTSEGMGLKKSLVLFGLAAFAILICGPPLAYVSDALAEKSGLGGTFVGTTFVAFTTSLPEIITTITAVRLGAYELAAGNIFGSNCFNMAILPFVDLFYQEGPILKSINPVHALTASFVMINTSIATMGLLYRVEKRFWIIEPDALLLVILSIGSLVLVMLAS